MSNRDMENTMYTGLRCTYKWNVYKSVCRRRWVVWNTAWVKSIDPMLFDTWQQAIDYANGKVES